ncbi:MAG: hypothetical protein WC071_06925 [Victivallaceae bacterium]
MDYYQKKINRLVAALLISGNAAILMLTLSSCAWITGGTSDAEVTELEKDMRVEQRKTVFEQSLAKLGFMLKGYGVPKTPVQSKNIGNQTVEKDVPSDLYTMIATTISKIGRPLVFVPYDAQYVVDETTTGGTINRLYPQVVITGGITGFDKDMIEKEREMEASGGWAGAEGGGNISTGSGLSRVTIDLSMMDYKTQAYFPGVIVSNSILVTRDKLGWGVYGYYMGNGAAFDYELKRKQGVNAALRTVLEFSLVELIGKQFEVPYWKCIEGAAPDQKMIDRLRDEFTYTPESNQALKIKKLLFLHGYDVEKNVPTIQGFEEKIIRTEMSANNCVTLSDLYIKLWLSVPIDKSLARLAIEERYRLRESRDQQRQAEAENKEKIARAAEQQRQQKAELQARVNSFKANVAAGNELFGKQKYQEAAVFYTKAHELFPGEHYPVQKLNEIHNLNQQKQVAAEQRVRLSAEAEQRFAAAENVTFNQSNYRQALQAVQAALSADPDNKKLAEMLETVNNKLAKYKSVWETGKDNEW